MCLLMLSFLSNFGYQVFVRAQQLTLPPNFNFKVLLRVLPICLTSYIQFSAIDLPSCLMPELKTQISFSVRYVQVLSLSLTNCSTLELKHQAYRCTSMFMFTHLLLT